MSAALPPDTVVSGQHRVAHHPDASPEPMEPGAALSQVADEATTSGATTSEAGRKSLWETLPSEYRLPITTTPAPAPAPTHTETRLATAPNPDASGLIGMESGPAVQPAALSTPAAAPLPPPTAPGTAGASSVALSDNKLIDSLLEGTKWGESTPGSGAALTFSFKTPDTIGIAPSNPAYAQAPWYLDDAQKQAVRDALGEWAKVANLTFTEVPETADSQGDLRFGGTYNTPDVRTAEASVLLAGQVPENGEVWLGKKFLDRSADPQSGGLTPGGYGFMALMHETGHALGLKHPHDTSPANPLLTPAEQDTQRETVMSYNLQFSTLPATPQALDIAAIQYLYGPNTRYNSDDTTYQFGANAPVFHALWDAGGINTLDASNQTQGLRLDLNPGARSSIGSDITDSNARTVLMGLPSARSNNDYLLIAQGTTIQNAIGSNFDDTIAGNAADNVIEGGGGNDTLRGEAGYDRAIYRVTTSPQDAKVVADPNLPSYWHVVNKEDRPLLNIWQAYDGSGYNVKDVRAAEDIPEGHSSLGQDFLTDIELIDWTQPINGNS